MGFNSGLKGLIYTTRAGGGVISTGVKRPLHKADIFLGAFAKLRKATVSFVTAILLSVCICLSATGHIFVKFVVGDHFGNCGEKSRFV
jgi:hypothetical protein